LRKVAAAVSFSISTHRWLKWIERLGCCSAASSRKPFRSFLEKE
jgi:hypothetical protein